jgi:uncharacterized protein YukE
MKLTPVTGPGAISPNGTPEHVRTARAIEAFNRANSPVAPTQGQQQEHPVQNASNVAVEELGALKQTTEEPARDDNTPVEDSPAGPEPEAKKEDPALSRQFAQLARQERQLRVKAQQQKAALDAREADLKAREAALGQQPSFDPKEYIPRSRIKQEALTVLAEEGIDYNELTQQVLNQQPVDARTQATINELKAQIAELKQSTKQSQDSYQEQQKQAYQAAVKQIEMDARSLVKGDPAEFEAIAKTGSVKDVVDLIVKTHEKTGVVMSVEEAAREVENYLVEEGFNVSTRIEKIKRRIQQAAQPKGSPQQSQAKPQTQSPGMKTLTNAASSTRKLSARERALLAFKGELKS